MPNRRAILKLLGSIAIWPLGCVQNDEKTTETQQKAKAIEPTVPQEPETIKPTVPQKPGKNKFGNIKDKVKEIIVEQLGVDAGEVKDGASFIDDLGADSLDTVELIMAFEEEFDIEIPDEDAEKLTTVGDAISYLEKKIEQSIK